MNKAVTVLKNDNTSSLTVKQHASNRSEMTGSQWPGMFGLAYKCVLSVNLHKACMCFHQASIYVKYHNLLSFVNSTLI